MKRKKIYIIILLVLIIVAIILLLNKNNTETKSIDEDKQEEKISTNLTKHKISSIKQNETYIDTAIVNTIAQNKVNLNLLKSENNLTEFKISDEIINDIGESKLLSIKYEIPENSSIPKLISVKKLNKTLINAYLKEKLDDNMLLIKVNNKTLKLGYNSSLNDKINNFCKEMNICIELDSNSLITDIN